MRSIEDYVLEELPKLLTDEQTRKLLREVVPTSRRKRAKIEYGYVSLDDFDRLLAKIPPREEMYAIAFGFMRYRGLRPCEVVALRIQDVLPEGQIRHHSTKTNRISTMALPELFRARFEKYVENNKHRFINGYLFVGITSKSDHIQVDQVRKKFRYYFRKAGLSCDFQIDTNKTLLNAGRKLNYTRLYDLRASFGTDVMQLTKDIYKASVMLRHTDTRATHAYMRRAVLVSEREIVNKLFPKVQGR
jgi:integrase